jgi:PLP dependent protein
MGEPYLMQWNSMTDIALIATIKANIADALMRVRACAHGSLLSKREPLLIAVSKGQPEERVMAALKAGHRIFGENRIQESQTRWPALRAQYPDVELHLIGHLQSNKAKEAVELFDVIHSIDRPSVAEAVAKAAEQSGKAIKCFVQVNTGEEEQKSGVAPQELADFLDFCAKQKLDIIGLMCIPPADENPAQHFGFLHLLAKRHGLKNLSMGMSGDFEAAIRYGATHVRIGTAIFGERHYPA